MAEERSSMMNLSKTKRNFIGLLTLLTLVSAGAGAMILRGALPEYYFEGYPFIPIYFYILGLLSMYIVDAYKRFTPQKVLLLYMAMKVMKMILSLVLILIYCLIVDEQIKAFLLTFVSFYLVYLIVETWFFFAMNWKRKKEKQE